MQYKEIKGNLIELALKGNFQIIAHGANCFCRMKSGIAKQISEKIPDAVRADNETKPGDITKLGNFTIGSIIVGDKINGIILNLYTQYMYGTDSRKVDYEALTLCLRKVNKIYANSTIGLPMIGAGLAGGDWNLISKIIRRELFNMDVTIVIYEP